MLLSFILTVTQNCPSVAKIVGPSGVLYCLLSVKFDALLKHQAQPKAKHSEVMCTGFLEISCF